MARLLFMSDFTESYATNLLKGILRYSRLHDPWVVCKMPLAFRDKRGILEVADFASQWKADAIIGQFYDTDKVEVFQQRGIIAIAQDYQSRFANIPNITGEHRRGGQLCADYFIRRGYHHFAFYGLKGMVWSDERKEGFCQEIAKRVKNSSLFLQEEMNLDDTWWYNMSELTAWLDSLPKPVAILACDDNRAYQIVEACQQTRRMRIPDDIAILGIDNDESVCLLSSPQLSSLNQGTEEAGYETARMIDLTLQQPLEKRFQNLHDVINKVTFITTRNSTDAFIHQNRPISQALSYISKNIYKPITVDAILGEITMSRRNFETLFRKEMNISIYQYVLNVKVEKMKELLMSGYSIQQVAQELSIDNLKGMSRTFKQHVGMTMTEFVLTSLSPSEQ